MNSSSQKGYKRVTGVTRCNGFRGFRLNLRKLSIQKLRVRFMHFFKVLFKWRKSYERAVKSLRKGITGRSCERKCSGYSINTSCYQSKSRLLAGGNKVKPESCRLRSLGRTNSFYTEAIADCLEFIKRNSVSLDDPHDEAAPLASALR